ncbi:MAG: ATP-grasp domain-containing protein [Actinobacteria bacterium]|nr:MAG: ATP-grasp domain-containing protein [Actinomycetota bacterium]
MAFILIGGSRSQLGLLEQARALGHEVCVVDGAETAPLLAEADVGIVQDFSDVEGVLNALRERGVEPEAVATMGSDQAVLPTAHFAERLGLPGLPVQTAEIVADKRLMRAAFEAAEVPAPRGREVGREDAAEALAEIGLPAVVKPVDGSGQRGVTKVRSAEEFPAALERALAASRTGAAVLERFLEGDELTVNGFLLEGEYFPMSVTQRLLHPPPPLGVCIAHRYPSGLSAERERKLFALAHAASRAVGIDTGPSYVQLRVDGDDNGVIEVGARLGGGKDAELAKLVTGFDAIRAETLRALGGLTPGDLGPGEPVAPVGQVRFVVAPPGRIVRLNAAPALELDGVHEAGFYWREGMVLPPMISGAERLGYLLLTAGSDTELDDLTDRALHALHVEIAVERVPA